MKWIKQKEGLAYPRSERFGDVHAGGAYNSQKHNGYRVRCLLWRCANRNHRNADFCKSSKWVLREINLTPYAGQIIIIKIYLEDLGSHNGCSDHHGWIAVVDFWLITSHPTASFTYLPISPTAANYTDRRMR